MTTPLETILLEDAGCRVHLAPGRGGIATRFFVGDRPVFYLDETTLIDATKNVRGGNPVLFPSPGKLAGDRFERAGRSGSMGQHGFARNSAWEIASQDARSATLRLRSNDVTRAAYPWDFVATYRYAIANDTLRIEQHFEGDEGMPFGAGFHPYFAVTDKARARVATKATRAWDNAAKKEIALGGPIDLTEREVDLHLLDHDSDHCTLDLGDAKIDVRARVPTWVVWTLAGKDFVCVEPWTCPGNALNTGEHLLVMKRTPVELVTEIAFAKS